jgi:hypothetical protein
MDSGKFLSGLVKVLIVITVLVCAFGVVFGFTQLNVWGFEKATLMSAVCAAIGTIGFFSIKEDVFKFVGKLFGKKEE